MAALHQRGEEALGHHGVLERQARKLDLRRVVVDGDVVQHPVVERSVILELQRTQRVRDALQRIADAVREVVHRIDAPVVAGAVVAGMANPIQHRIPQVDVGRRHVDPGAQHARAFGELASLHGAQQAQILGHAAVAVRARRARFGQRAAGGADLFCRQGAHICLAAFDELFGEAVELVEVVRRERRAGPVEAEPANIAHDRLDVLGALREWIGVVEAQVGPAAELLGDAEVQADRLRMADVQKAVRLRRKARHDALVASRIEIAADALADEIPKIGRHFGALCLELADCTRSLRSPNGRRTMGYGCNGGRQPLNPLRRPAAPRRTR